MIIKKLHKNWEEDNSVTSMFAKKINELIDSNNELPSLVVSLTKKVAELTKWMNEINRSRSCDCGKCDVPAVLEPVGSFVDGIRGVSRCDDIACFISPACQEDCDCICHDDRSDRLEELIEDTAATIEELQGKELEDELRQFAKEVSEL